MFQRIDVNAWELMEDETTGAEVKHWLRDPIGKRWLFKNTTVKEGFRYAEDWGEKIASHLAASLTIPSARIELAHREGLEGIISLDVRPFAYDIQPGMVWMPAVGIKGYRAGNDKSVKGRPGHSLANIKQALTGLLPPPTHQFPDGFSAFDAFAGYLVLDAWVANRDRHDQNWSILWPQLPNLPICLAASYDLGSSLGFNTGEAEMIDRLAGNRHGVENWAAKGTAYRLECVPPAKPVSLVRAAFDGLVLCSDEARKYWVGQINRLDLKLASHVVAQVPEMSDARRRFIDELLQINAERLQHECSTLI